MCLRYFLQRQSKKATPSCRQSCFLLRSGPLVLQSHWSRSESCRHQKEHPSPGRSLSTSHSNQETKRLQRTESQSLPCRRYTLLSSLVSRASLGACDCWAGPASRAAEWTLGSKTASAAALPPKLHPAAVILRGLLLGPRVTHNYPLSPEGCGAAVKMQVRVVFFNVMRMIMRT